MHNVPAHRVLILLEYALDVNESGTPRAVKVVVKRR
jgi:hypothetical protein